NDGCTVRYAKADNCGTDADNYRAQAYHADDLVAKAYDGDTQADDSDVQANYGCTVRYAEADNCGTNADYLVAKPTTAVPRATTSAPYTTTAPVANLACSCTTGFCMAGTCSNCNADLGNGIRSCMGGWTQSQCNSQLASGKFTWCGPVKPAPQPNYPKPTAPTGYYVYGSYGKSAYRQLNDEE
ncbi:hypothetical protein ACHHYP_20746, partial [Achlya hypogyna]